MRAVKGVAVSIFYGMVGSVNLNLAMLRCLETKIMKVKLLKEVQCNCSTVRSAHLFIITISSHSHIRRRQPQKTFLQYSCSVTIVNIVTKYLSKKIHELITLIGSSNDSYPQVPNEYIGKNRLLQNNYWWLFLLFR